MPSAATLSDFCKSLCASRPIGLPSGVIFAVFQKSRVQQVFRRVQVVRNVKTGIKKEPAGFSGGFKNFVFCLKCIDIPHNVRYTNSKKRNQSIGGIQPESITFGCSNYAWNDARKRWIEIEEEEEEEDD